MGRQPGCIYRNRQGKLRLRYPFPEGKPWNQFIPAPDDGTPLDDAWADIYLAAFRRKVKAGWDPRAGQTLERALMTVGEYAIGWLKTQTYEDAKRDVQRLTKHLLPSELARMKLIEVKPRHCLAYVNWLKARPSARGGTLAARSVRTMAACVQRAFSQAARDELIPVTPWNLPPHAIPSVVDKVLGAREGWLFTVDEVRALCYSEKLTEERRAMWATLFLAGPRAGELVALRVKDWDRTKEPLGSLSVNKSRSTLHGVIKSPKTNVARSIPVHPALAEILNEWVLGGLAKVLGRDTTKEDLLFPSPQHGKERSGNSIRKHLNTDLATLGYRPRRAHDTRRTHITMLVDAGARREIFSVWTHGKKKDVISSYTTASWSTYCAEMMRLEFQRSENKTIGSVIAGLVGLDKMLSLQREEGKRAMRFELAPRRSASSLSASYLPLSSRINTTSRKETNENDHSVTAVTIGLYTSEALLYAALELAELREMGGLPC